MKSKVFFSDMRTTPRVNQLKKLKRLFERVEPGKMIQGGDLVAIKLHFGEKGNTAYVKPVYLRVLSDFIRKLGGKPFLTDTNTLYVGSRKESVSHIRTAIENGFDFSVVNTPVIIADGIRGRSAETVKIDKKWYKEVGIASDIHNADSLICVTHFKCHELTGFGGTIKNIGMGCSALKGKLEQHSDVNPYVSEPACTGCLRCLSRCPAEGAILRLENGKVRINNEKCIGCGECILTCRDSAIKIKWDAQTQNMQEKMIEHMYGVLKVKKNRCAFLTFVTNVSPACDCYPSNDAPIVRDIGMLASKDPIAIDQAAADLVNNQQGNRESHLKSNFEPGEDKFRGVYPEIDWNVQLKYGEEIGLGSRDYQLVSV